jgi:hypothetical protein
MEFNLLYNKASSFAVTEEDVANITAYMRGSIKDMQSLLIDVGNNIPLDEEQFRKVEDERVSLRCNFRKVCRGEV